MVCAFGNSLVEILGRKSRNRPTRWGATSRCAHVFLVCYEREAEQKQSGVRFARGHHLMSVTLKRKGLWMIYRYLALQYLAVDN
jgi:hypothetical protein